MQAFPPKGGNHVHAIELTQGFVDAGHEVFVLDDPAMPRVTSLDSNDSEGLKLFVSSIEILYVRIDARSLKEWPMLAKCMTLVGDIPIVWEINSPANEWLAFSWLGGRQLSPEGDQLDSSLKRAQRWVHAARNYPKVWMEESYRRSLAPGVSAAICVSSAVGQYAKDLGIRNVSILPNGGPLLSSAEIALRGRKKSTDRFTVFYSGSAIYPWQGIDYLAEVIRLAAVDAPDIRFVLAVNQRTELVPDLPNVEVLEHLNREEILDAICTADACVAVHPQYTWSKYGFHNSPMKLFEYMACMRPVVTSNHGQMAELIRHGEDGLLCENNPRKILSQLLWLRDNPQRAEKMGKATWLRIQEEFSWNHVVGRTLELFTNLLAQKKAG